MAREFSLRSVPEELRTRYLRERLWTVDTLGTLVDGSLRARPAVPFRIWSERRPFAAPLGDVHEQARRLAAGLQGWGLGPGDVVAFQLPNWAEAVATFFGLAMLGVVLVPSPAASRWRRMASRSVVDEFPRTPSGKIRKFVLREALRAEHATRTGR